MKLIFESWRRYKIKVEEHLQENLMGGYQGEYSEERLKIVSLFDDLKFMAPSERAFQIASVILGTKPLFYSVTEEIPNGQFSEEFLDYLKNKGLVFAKIEHYVPGGEEAFFIGNRNNVKEALRLFKIPHVGIEKMKYPEEFVSWAKSNPVTNYEFILAATPEFHRRLGVLLGYGEENSLDFAKKVEDKWNQIYNVWKGSKE